MAEMAKDRGELWYSDLFKRWVFSFGGKRFSAPKSIGRTQRGAAEEWVEKSMDRFVEAIRLEGARGPNPNPDPGRSKGGRPSSVWWWESHKRWAFNVGRKRIGAPKSIGPNDRRAAERWHREAMAALGRPVAEPLPGNARVRKEFLLKVSTVRRLKRLAKLNRVGSARVIDGLVERESRAIRAAKAE